MGFTLDLDDPICQQREVVGDKAARLALARAKDLPVPDSLVVPCGLSRIPLREARQEVGSKGHHHGRLQIMGSTEASLVELEIAAVRLGGSLAVRSSAPGESDARLAGAFSSFLGVRPEDLGTAVRGVWASAIQAQDAISAEARVDDWPATVEQIGVLVQRDLEPEFAGTAESLRDGSVRVVATPGSAAPLMGGWTVGTTVLLGKANEFGDQPLPGIIEVGMVQCVADLCRATVVAIGDNFIEWAWKDDKVWLVQAKTVDRAVVPNRISARRRRLALGSPSRSVDLALALNGSRFAGELGERLVMPWAGSALPPIEQIAFEPLPADFSASSTWSELQRLSGGLEQSVLGGSVDQEDIEPTIREFRRQAGLLASWLKSADHLIAPAQLWAMPANLGEAITNESVPRGVAARARVATLDREAMLFEAVMAMGQKQVGLPVAAGMGAGAGIWLDDLGNLTHAEQGQLPERGILLAASPLPRYAPLLMGAAGFVTAGGSEAAHLMEVARSMGVPVVIVPNLDMAAHMWTRDTFVALDGTSGTVSVLQDSGSTTRNWMPTRGRTGRT